MSNQASTRSDVNKKKSLLKDFAIFQKVRVVVVRKWVIFVLKSAVDRGKDSESPFIAIDMFKLRPKFIQKRRHCVDDAIGCSCFHPMSPNKNGKHIVVAVVFQPHKSTRIAAQGLQPNVRELNCNRNRNRRNQEEKMATGFWH